MPGGGTFATARLSGRPRADTLAYNLYSDPLARNHLGRRRDRPWFRHAARGWPRPTNPPTTVYGQLLAARNQNVRRPVTTARTITVTVTY